jgi:hypothetical protein
MSEVIVISHSEVESYLSCQRKHFYAFGDSTFGDQAGLEPTSFSDSLFRGIIGHEVLSVFYSRIKEGDSVESAGERSFETLRAIGARPDVLTHPSHLKIVIDLAGRILPRFYANEAVQALNQGWFPVHVEETFRLRFEIGDKTYVYPFRPDVIMRDAAGNLWVWDHKFVYNFYTDDQIKLLPQIPKYVGALRACTDLYIKGGFYNQLRWREVKDLNAHVRHDKFVPSDTRIKNAFRQQYRVMGKIAALKSQATAEWEENVDAVLSTMVCKSCSFKHLCAADLDGQDTKLMKLTEFRGNTYGYTETAEG